jgi:hypothetical protein
MINCEQSNLLRLILSKMGNVTLDDIPEPVLVPPSPPRASAVENVEPQSSALKYSDWKTSHSSGEHCNVKALFVDWHIYDLDEGYQLQLTDWNVNKTPQSERNPISGHYSDRKRAVQAMVESVESVPSQVDSGSFSRWKKDLMSVADCAINNIGQGKTVSLAKLLVVYKEKHPPRKRKKRGATGAEP